MPLKTSHPKPHHTAHKKEKRSKHFLKVYAPYIPLLVIVGCGIFVSGHQEMSNFRGVKSYATNTTDYGLLDATNKDRLEQGLKPLVLNETLDKAAQSKAEDMAARNYWAHVTPDGKQPWSFIDAAGYHYKKAAENLAYGFTTSDSTLEGWMNSPGHRANVLDANLEEVGFGIINVPDYQQHGEETIVVAMYGQPATSASSPVTTVAAATPTVASVNQQKSVSYFESITKGKAPWASLAVGILIGSIVMYLTVKHARSLRKTLKRGERFVVKHPLFDITLVALAALAVIVSQTIGNIY